MKNFYYITTLGTDPFLVECTPAEKEATAGLEAYFKFISKEQYDFLQALVTAGEITNAEQAVKLFESGDLDKQIEESKVNSAKESTNSRLSQDKDFVYNDLLKRKEALIKTIESKYKFDLDVLKFFSDTLLKTTLGNNPLSSYETSILEKLATYRKTTKEELLLENGETYFAAIGEKIAVNVIFNEYFEALEAETDTEKVFELSRVVQGLTLDDVVHTYHQKTNK